MRRRKNRLASLHKRVSRAFTLFCLFSLSLIVAACQGVDKLAQDERFVSPDSLVPIFKANFHDYQRAVYDWIVKNRVNTTVFDRPDAEWNINAPFECGSRQSEQAALFVHGLGDSPFFMRDVALVLCEEGIYVRTVLLTGHGSKPGDLLNSSYNDWQHQVDFYVHQLKREFEKVWLGGFSTGANLVTTTAFKVDVEGLLLFSPAFKSRLSATWLSPYLTGGVPWPNVEPEDNPTRYNSIPMQGFSSYQGSVDAVTGALQTKPYSKPTFMVLAEGGGKKKGRWSRG